MLADKARRVRRCYAALVRLYPRPFRERYSEPMQQTFADLLNDRIGDERPAFASLAWVFAETLAGAIGEHMNMLVQRKTLIRPLLGTLLILMVPLVAMRFTGEVNWGLEDFVVGGALLMGAGLTFELIAQKAAGSLAYRAAVAIAVAGGLFLVWVNLAVGILGHTGNAANLMYLGVLVVGIAGSVLVRFQPQGMSRAMLAMAGCQVLVAAIALAAGLGQTFLITALFVAIWLLSAWLFHRSAGNAAAGP